MTTCTGVRRDSHGRSRCGCCSMSRTRLRPAPARRPPCFGAATFTTTPRTSCFRRPTRSPMRKRLPDRFATRNEESCPGRLSFVRCPKSGHCDSARSPLDWAELDPTPGTPRPRSIGRNSIARVPFDWAELDPTPAHPRPRAPARPRPARLGGTRSPAPPLDRAELDPTPATARRRRPARSARARSASARSAAASRDRATR